jgi:hypothetical protein
MAPRKQITEPIAINRIATILGNLSYPAQKRVAAWIYDKFYAGDEPEKGEAKQD